MESDYVYTLAKSNKNDSIGKSTIALLQESLDKSQIIREHIAKSVAENYNYPLQKITIKKDGIGAPEIYIDHEKTALSCTITHHGDYAAFSIQ